MLKKFLSSILAIMLVAGTMLCTGCSGSTEVDVSGKETDITQVYQFNATCSGPQLVPNTTNKITLTKATSSSPAVSFYDFKVKVGNTIYAVSAKSAGTNKTVWEGTPKVGATTLIRNATYTTSVGGKVNLASTFKVKWKTLSDAKNGIRNGEAIVTF